MALTIQVASSDADLNSINTLLNAKTPVTGSGATVTYGAKTLTDTAGGFLSLPATIVGMTATVGAKVGTIASRTATVITLTANWSGGAPAAGSAYSIAPGFSIRDELIADFVSVIPFTLAFWHPFLSDPDSRVVMGFNPANTLRGAAYWHLEGNVWVLKLVGVDKSLTAAQRIDGFVDFLTQLCQSVPRSTLFAGLVKPGGKLDTRCQSRLALNGGTRELTADGFAKYTQTAGSHLDSLAL